MKRSDQINELASAMSKFQGQIKNAPKDSANPYFHSTYTDLATAWDAIRGPLSANGLSVVQDAVVAENKVSITSLLMHTSGQWIESTIDFVPKDMGPQSVGSCLSYGRRYLLMSQTGLAGEDDDGEAGEGRKKEAQRQPPRAEHKEPSKEPAIGLAPESGKEQPKAEPDSYFSKIMVYVNSAPIGDNEKISIIAKARKVKGDEAALKEIYDGLAK